MLTLVGVFILNTLTVKLVIFLEFMYKMIPYFWLRHSQWMESDRACMMRFCEKKKSLVLEPWQSRRECLWSKCDAHTQLISAQIRNTLLYCVFLARAPISSILIQKMPVPPYTILAIGPLYCEMNFLIFRAQMMRPSFAITQTPNNSLSNR